MFGLKRSSKTEWSPPASAIEALRCPTCRDGGLDLDGGRFLCGSCSASFAYTDGIVDLVPSEGFANVKRYRTESLDDALASTYDFVWPVMSTTVWRCDPLRFVDWANMTLGWARQGLHLALPVTTGGVIRHIWGDYVGATVIAADRSWNMLTKARDRFAAAGIPALMVRADVDALPFATGAFDSVLSLNGLHAFDQRAHGIGELWRVTAPGGLLAGSTLTRDGGAVATTVLDLYEKYGISPMLRGREFVLSELRGTCADAKLLNESYGAVLFFSAQAPS